MFVCVKNLDGSSVCPLSQSSELSWSGYFDFLLLNQHNCEFGNSLTFRFGPRESSMRRSNFFRGLSLASSGETVQWLDESGNPPLVAMTGPSA